MSQCMLMWNASCCSVDCRLSLVQHSNAANTPSSFLAFLHSFLLSWHTTNSHHVFLKRQRRRLRVFCWYGMPVPRREIECTPKFVAYRRTSFAARLKLGTLLRILVPDRPELHVIRCPRWSAYTAISGDRKGTCMLCCGTCKGECCNS